MKAREFKLYNNNGDMIDFLDNLDFFGVNPEGLGAQFDNSFKRSGVNFLKDESELTGGVFKISLIFGMQTGNPYNRYAEFIELLNKPPYRLVYGTSAGTYSRQCVLNEITKTEIKSGDVLLEDFSLDFTTPWYNEIAEEIDPVEDKDGDGKIYALQKYKSQTPELPRRIKWWGPPESDLSANIKFTDVPKGGYQAGDIWYWKDGQVWDGMNRWNSMKGVNAYDRYSKLISETKTQYVFELLSPHAMAVGNTGLSSRAEDGDIYNLDFRLLLNDVPHDKYFLERNHALNSQSVATGGASRDRNIGYGDGKWSLQQTYRTSDSQWIWHTDWSPQFKIGDKLTFQNIAFYKGARKSIPETNPSVLLNGKTSGYFMASKSNSTFDFNDWVPAPFDPNNYADIKKGDIWLYDPEEYTLTENYNRDVVHYAIAKRDATKLDVKDWAPYSGPIIHDDVPSIYRKGDIWMYDDSQLWLGKNLWSKKKAVKGYIGETGSIFPPDAKNLTTHKIPMTKNILDKRIYIAYNVYIDQTSPPQTWEVQAGYRSNDTMIGSRLITLGATGPVPRWEESLGGYSAFHETNIEYWRWSARYLDSPHAEVYLSWGIEEKQISMYDTYGQSAMMVAKFSSSDYFAFDDWEFYDQTSLTDASMHAYIYDYIYEGDTLSIPNSFVIRNDSRHLGQANGSPIEITVHGPVTNPRWEVIVGSKVVQTDGFNLSVPAGHRLVVSSVPGNQYAKIISNDGLESNVYQYQHLNMTNFVTIPGGTSTLVFYNCKRVNFKYREERVLV